ncbi:unannotated protein [freshwater metagenome]|uniref:Unannotated protein n=1 Tax=freshwater metagenome TaxID=449393 RepID=A0A6J6HYX8_9ZZZZ
MGDGGLTEEERRIHVDCGHASVLRFAHVGEMKRSGDSGHIYKDVESTKRLDRFCNGVEAFRTLADIADTRDGGAASRRDERHRLGQ